MKPLVLAGLLWVALVPLWSQETPSATLVVPAAGTYVAPVSVVVTPPPGASVRYRFLETPGTATFPWKDSLVLDALPGETRTYTLRLTTDLASGEASTRDYKFGVTREASSVPTVHPEPGLYWSAITVKADLPPGWTALVNGNPAVFPLTLDAVPGQHSRFEFLATGPEGQPMRWQYQVDRRDQESLSLDLMSPREGEWANSQPLVVLFRGTDQVLWSYGPTLDTATAQPYTEPVALDRPGPQTLTVAARSRIDGRWISRTVRWGNGAQTLEGWPQSGVVNGLTLPAVDGSVSWDDGRSWVLSPGGRAEAASVTARKVLTFQVRRGPLFYRYVYWLDARAPETPIAEFLGGWNPRVRFSGSTETVHRVTWIRADGTSLDEPGMLWGPVGSWKVPDGIVGARIRTSGGNGIEGPAVSIGFAETGWSTPTWEPWDQQGPLTDKTQLPLGGRVLARQGFWPVYTVSDRPDLAEPGPRASLLNGAFLPTVPWGADRTLYVRFAWRDAVGLVGPGSAPLAVRVDRVPPSPPEIVTLGGQVLVKPSEGEEAGGNLQWAVTSDRVSSAELLTFQPYRAALDLEGLRSGANGRLWFHAQAQDRAGNVGSARLNVVLPPLADQATSVVQVDSDPGVGEVPVENGGVYPWPLFRLRAVDQGSDLWVGVSDQAGVPDDWKSRVQPWTGPLTRGIARGERRSFLLYWNSRTASGWAWETPKTLELTLDLAAPSAPVVSGSWPTAPLGGPWNLKILPGRSGDRLRYTVTLDGSVPPDPVDQGDPWPGNRSWDAPPGGQIQVRVRLVAISASGLAIETPLGPGVVIDRSPPVAVVAPLSPFTYAAGPQTIPLPPGAGLVRFSLSADGQLPTVPTESSTLVPATGLVLEGRVGESVLYRFWWRSYSLSGVPGVAAGPYSVLVDRTAVSTPTVGSDARRLPSPRLIGFPASGQSAAGVTVTAEASAGLLRYEVREGVGVPRAVTPQSALWEAPLVLDGGEGVDRSFAVSVRLFSVDGQPLSDEALYSVRVDRAPPEVPILSLVADTRRPEAVLRPGDEVPHPEETLFYRWSWTSFPASSGTSEWATLSDPEAVFSAPGGALTSLTVEAYWKDEVGNVGPVVQKSLLIDQNVVYLDPSGIGDGSRSQPAGVLSDAVDRARREGKSILLVAVGTYPVHRTLNLGGLQVYGGLAASQWEASTPARSQWTAAPGFQGTCLIESGDADWTLSNVDISTGTVGLSQVVNVKGGVVALRHSTWIWAGSPRGWTQEGGSVSWTNVGVTYAAENRGVFFEGKSLESTIRGLRLSATQNQGGLLVSLSASTALFQDLVVVSKNAKGFDGLVSASQSRLTVDQARIQGGDGADRSTAFFLNETEATLWNTDVSLYGAAANTGFQTSGGRLEVQKGSLSLLKGTEYNQGLVLDDSRTVLRSFQVTIEAGSYQGGLSLDGGTLTVGTSIFALAGGGQRVWGAQFLSEVGVTLDDVAWTLKTKTPGDLWKLEKPWAKESSTQGIRVVGW